MKICFWGNIAGALKGKTEGGGELQIAFIARALAVSGHEVVVVDYGTLEDFITPEGIQVKTIKKWNKGIRLIRTLTHRIPGLYSTLLEQNADIYYCRIRDFRHLIPYMVARRLKAKFVLHLAADLDAVTFAERLRKFYFEISPSPWWFFSGLFIELVYPFLLRKADLVLAQHKGQQEILARKSIDSVVFLNLISTKDIAEYHYTDREDFVYVGWLDKRKGFPDFYDIVIRTPQHTFKIIGPPRDITGERYFEKLKSYSNVKLLGGLSHAKTLAEISRSKALISTSPMEGFPNVFIEAWACGIPVYSLNVDPGDVIATEGLGVIANGNPDTLIKAMDDHVNSAEFAAKALNYIEDHHSMSQKKVEEINMVFTSLKYGKTPVLEKAVL